MAADRRVTEREHELREREQAFDLAVNERDRQLKDLETRGAKRFAVSAVAGFSLGAGLAYLAHDEIAMQFGKGTLPAVMALPVTGGLVFWQAQKYFKKNRKVPVTTRIGTYAGALGTLIVGGYLGYEDYVAMNPPKK